MAKKSKKAKAVETQVEANVEQTVEQNMAEGASVSDAAIEEAVVEQMTAVEDAQAEAPVSEVAADEATVSEPVASDTRSLSEVIDTLTKEQVDGCLMATAASLDERADFEKAKNPDNDSIQKHLAKSRKQLATHASARVLLATNVSAEMLNREKHTGSRYNVYAMGKLADLIGAAAGGLITNKINFAIVKSLVAFRDAGLPFTSDIAKGAASDKHRVDASVRKHLTSHTVSASTASTQASSTLQALETLGAIRRVGGERNCSFELIDAPITRALEGALAKAA